MRRWFWAQLLAAATMMVSAASAHAESTIDLTRISSDSLLGKPWLVLSNSMFCLGAKPVEWTSRDVQAVDESPLLTEGFRRELADAHYKVAGSDADLFAEKSDNADLQVGARITSLNVKICHMDGDISLYRGEASMAVEWQIYSTAKGRVLARIPVTGTSTLKLSTNDAPAAVLLRRVFENSAQLLAASGEFRALANDAADPSPPPVASGPIALITPAAPAELPMAQAQTAVVSIFTSDGMGSGFLVSADGYLLTNHHVAGDRGQVRVRWPNGQETVGQVIRSDRSRDVALLKTDVPAGLQVLSMRAGPVAVGDTVFAIGTPREKAFAGTVTRGVISSTDRVMDGEHYIQSDVAITHGNSGGPLLDEHGRVVGISQSVYEPGGVSQNINFFVPIGEALQTLALTVPAPAPAPAATKRSAIAKKGR